MQATLRAVVSSKQGGFSVGYSLVPRPEHCPDVFGCALTGARDRGAYSNFRTFMLVTSARYESLEASFLQVQEDCQGLHRAISDALFAQRDLWKHLSFVAYTHGAQRIEIGAELSQVLSDLLGRISPQELAQSMRPERRVRELFDNDDRGWLSAFKAQFKAVGTALAVLGDNTLSDLWERGTWYALYCLLTTNLLHCWEPTHELWNAPGAKERSDARRAEQAARPQAAGEGSEYAGPSDADWELIVSSARAFPELRPFPSHNYQAPVKMFLCGYSTIGFNPLHTDSDAQRLADRLHIFVTIEGGLARASVGPAMSTAISEPLGDHAGDAKAAARRAVTRAAALFLDSGRAASFRFI